MTFLNPALLFGLGAVAIPVVLHLLNLKKLRTVEFSTLAFLKELQKSQMRKLKLRQILLLLLRTLVIAAIVLAFARPALRGSAAGGIGTHAKTTAVILLDNSFSMSASDDHGSLFAQAKVEAAKSLSMLREGDEVLLWRTSQRDAVANSEVATHSLPAVRSAIVESRIGTSFRSLGELFPEINSLLKQSKNLSKEIYIISDLQKTFFDLRDPGGAASKASGSEKITDHSRLFIIPVGTKPIPNVSVESVEIKNRFFEKDRPFTLETRIRNYGSTPLRNYTVGLYVDGKRVMQRSVDLPADGVVAQEFTTVPQRVGHLSGYVEIEPDAVGSDDRRYFTIFIPEKIKVLFVAEKTRDLSFLRLALMPDERSAASYDVQTITPSKILMSPVTSFDVIVLANVESLTSAQVERLKQYTTDGGGMIFFPGNNTDIERINAEFFQRLKIAGASGKFGDASDRKSFVTFESVDYEHPLFSGIFDERASLKKKDRKSIESPKVYSALVYRPGANGRTIIRLSNGGSFLTEYKIDNGKLLVYAIPATLEWSDFPVRGVFVPLIRRSLAYLASWNEETVDHLAGSAVDISIPFRQFPSGESPQLVHRTPEGDEEILQPSTVASRTGEQHYRITRTEDVGIHQLRRGDKLFAQFSANVDPRESDLNKLTPEEAIRLFTEHGVEAGIVQIIKPEQDAESIVLQSRFGIELWKYFLGLALLGAFVELIVARDRKEQAVSSG